MIARIVIGLGYGDEGKGLATDFLVNNSANPLVIRFSGGPQAGHTVWVDGKSHVHSNYGSGTFRNNTPSFFSEHTCVYPVTIERERKVLEEKTGRTPELHIHPLAKVITPFDVWNNRSCDANLKNGTCGLGIGKTMHRNNTSPFKLYAVDLLNYEVAKQKLIAIRNYYRVKELDDDLRLEIDEFLMAIENRSWQVTNYVDLSFKGYTDYIFEGSQGILLDMDFGTFPNVTYANTTSKNAHEIIKKIDGIKYKETLYVTRCYSTRHGNGEFTEKYIKLKNADTETNVNNEYQGRFKLGEIDYDLLNRALEVDKIYERKTTKKSLLVTCLDQRPYIEFDYDKLPLYLNRYESRSTDSTKIQLKQ